MSSSGLRLNLAHRGLTALPPDVFEAADSLEILDLSGNALTTLPDALADLPRLRVIFASQNPFTELPAVLGRCPALEVVGFKSCRIERVPAEALPARLRWLILTDNRIQALPDELGRRPRLQKLMLAGNRLSALPDTLADAHHLELLRLSANRFERLPPWLAQLPALTWLATSGNPFSREAEQAALRQAAQPIFPDAHLQAEDCLGEGASGVIHRARWTPDPKAAPDTSVHVAVKRFKGAMTSDGLPESEMATCLAAGTHPGLIRVLGRTADTAPPSDAPRDSDAETCGLVLELINPAFHSLAGPPSLQSCSRDVYADEVRPDLNTVLKVVERMASVAAQLHAHGVVHGDLYAHNILWRPDTGEALLGDFGAASFHACTGPEMSAALQAMEVRALGILIEELQGRLSGDTDSTAPAAEALRQWAHRCMAPIPTQRPCASELSEALRRLTSST